MLAHRVASSPVRLLFSGVCVVLLLSLTTSCVSFSPPRDGPLPFIDRADAQRRRQQDVEVSVAVLRPAESAAVFGLRLADKGVQPVWVRVRNDSALAYWFMPVFLDRDYFSPREVAYQFRSILPRGQNARIEQLLTSRQVKLYVAPKSEMRGYVYTNLTRGIKLVNIELVGPSHVLRYAFARETQIGEFDYRSVDVNRLYSSDQLQDVDEPMLRARLEALPCCTTNAKGDEAGDPLNLVAIGEEHEILVALTRSGWDFTETAGAHSVLRTIGSFLFGSSYRTSPVSPLYFHGRHQDFAMQRARATVSQRNHLRLWVTPLRLHGRPVWIGQVSRDIGVRFTFRSPFLSTHKIDPDVDEARAFLQEDLLLTEAVERWGLVKGTGVATPEAPRRNLTGDAYFTDGLRLVLVLSSTPRAVTEVEIFPWETMPPR